MTDCSLAEEVRAVISTMVLFRRRYFYDQGVIGNIEFDAMRGFVVINDTRRFKRKIGVDLARLS